MPTHFGMYPKLSDSVSCRHCGNRGTIVWEDLPAQQGREKELLRIEGDFFERLAPRPPYQIELVCNRCGAAQVERT